MERYKEIQLGRTKSFLISGIFDIEKLSYTISSKVGIEFYIGRNLKGKAYRFYANNDKFTIRGSPIITREVFRITVGTHHPSVYTEYQKEYDDLVGNIRSVLETF